MDSVFIESEKDCVHGCNVYQIVYFGCTSYSDQHNHINRINFFLNANFHNYDCDILCDT